MSGVDRGGWQSPVYIPNSPSQPVAWDWPNHRYGQAAIMGTGPNPNNLVQAASPILPVVIPTNGSSVALTWTPGPGGYPSSGMPIVAGGIVVPHAGVYVVTVASLFALTGAGLPAGLAMTFGYLAGGTLVQNLVVYNFASGNPANPGTYTATVTTLVGVATANEALNVQFGLSPPIGGANAGSMDGLSISLAFLGNAP